MAADFTPADFPDAEIRAAKFAIAHVQRLLRWSFGRKILPKSGEKILAFFKKV